jgi:hypothetical protein
MHKSQRSSKDHKHRHKLHPVVRGINTEVAGSSTSSIDSERVAFSNIMQEASAQAVLHMAKKKHRWTEHSQAFSIRRKLLYNTMRYANKGQAQVLSCQSVERSQLQSVDGLFVSNYCQPCLLSVGLIANESKWKLLTIHHLIYIAQYKFNSSFTHLLIFLHSVCT